MQHYTEVQLEENRVADVHALFLSEDVSTTVSIYIIHVRDSFAETL